MKKEFDFSEEFGKIDEHFIEDAGREWTGKRGADIRLYSRRIAAAAVLVLLCGVLAGSSGVQAAVSRFFTKIGQLWGVQEDLTPYTEILNQQQEKEGYILALNEVLLSDTRLYSDLTITSDYEKGLVECSGYVTINGRDYEVEETLRQSEQEETEETSAHYVYQMNFAEDIPEEITDMELHFLAYRNVGDLLDGENAISFDFAFSTDRGELEKNKISLPLDIEIPMKDGISMHLSDFTLTAVDSEIKAEIIGAAGETQPLSEGYLEGTDSLGNPVFYTGFPEEGGGFSFTSDLQWGFPSTDSQWLELALYTYEQVDEAVHQPFDTDGEEEYYLEDDSGPVNQVYYGEKFRIELPAATQK